MNDEIILNTPETVENEPLTANFEENLLPPAPVSAPAQNEAGQEAAEVEIIEAPIEDYEYENENEVESENIENETEYSARKPRIQSVFKVIFLLCLLALIGELVWIFVITPARPFSLISITGLEKNILSREEVLQIAGIGSKTSFLSFNRDIAKKRLLSIPLIESVNIVKQFPGTVRINIINRKPAAVFLNAVNGKMNILYFDKHGVVYKTERAQSDFIPLPIISGLDTGAFTEGTRLPSLYIPLFESIASLQEMSPEIFTTISEIFIMEKAFDGFDILIYPVHSKVKIRMQSVIEDEDLRQALLLIDVLEAQGKNVHEIDFRSGTASYVIGN